MARKVIVELSHNDATDLLRQLYAKGLRCVYYKVGLWGETILMDIESAIHRIEHSTYGVDIDEEDGCYYVYQPTVADMW